MHLRSVLIAERPREKYLMLLPAHDQQYPLIRMPQYRDTVCFSSYVIPGLWYNSGH